jgi:RimJ/RimL family protein N-acetyltransferase
MEFLKPETPEKLTSQFIVQNVEYSLKSHSKNWKILVWRQIVLLYVSGVWDPELYPYHFSDFWDIFCERKQRWDRVYFIVDANNMPIQSEEFRNYVKTNWLHLIDRGDFQLCIVEQKAMKRAIWGSIHRLLGVQTKIRLFKNHDQAFTWMKSILLAEQLMKEK